MEEEKLENKRLEGLKFKFRLENFNKDNSNLKFPKYTTAEFCLNIKNEVSCFIAANPISYYKDENGNIEEYKIGKKNY